MKKIILISSIALTLLSINVKGQTVLAQGKRVVLSANDRTYLLSLNLTRVTSSVINLKTIRYNDTADMILMLLQARKSFTQLIAKK